MSDTPPTSFRDQSRTLVNRLLSGHIKKRKRMRTTGANGIDREEIANWMGFESWEEFLPLIYRDHSISAIADLTGLCRRMYSGMSLRQAMEVAR